MKKKRKTHNHGRIVQILAAAMLCLVGIMPVIHASAEEPTNEKKVITALGGYTTDYSYIIGDGPDSAEDILPGTIPATIEDAGEEDVDITWTAKGKEYNKNTVGKYTYTGSVSDPYTVKKGVGAPEVVIEVAKGKVSSITTEFTDQEFAYGSLVSTASKGNTYLDKINERLGTSMEVILSNGETANVDISWTPENADAFSGSSPSALEKDTGFYKVGTYKFKAKLTSKPIQSTSGEKTSVATKDGKVIDVYALAACTTYGEAVANFGLSPEVAEPEGFTGAEETDEAKAYSNYLLDKAVWEYAVAYAKENPKETYDSSALYAADKYDVSKITLPSVDIIIRKAKVKEIVVDSTDITVYKGLWTKDDIADSQLDKTVTAKLDTGDIVSVEVAWDSNDYNKDAAGTYTFTGTIDSTAQAYYDFTEAQIPDAKVTVVTTNPYTGYIRPSNTVWGSGSVTWPSSRDTIKSLVGIDGDFSNVNSIEVVTDKTLVPVNASGSPDLDGKRVVDIGLKYYYYNGGHASSHQVPNTWTEFFDNCHYSPGNTCQHGHANSAQDYVTHFLGYKWVCDRCGGSGGTCPYNWVRWEYTSNVYAWFDSDTGTLYFINWDAPNEKITLPENSNEFFKDYSSVKSIDVSAFNASKISKNTNMFANCSSLETITLGSDWSFKDTANSGLASANYPTGQELFWHRQDGIAVDDGVEEGNIIETSIGNVDVYALGSYDSYEKCASVLGMAKAGEAEYDTDYAAWTKARNIRSICKAGGTFEANYNKNASTWQGTWVVGYGSYHRYWKIDGIGNPDNIFEEDNKDSAFTSYCWGQYITPSSGYYQRVEITKESQLEKRLKANNQNYRPLESEKNEADSMLRSFVAIMYYGDIEKNNMNSQAWQSLSRQERALVTLSAVQWCSDSNSTGYIANHADVVEELLSKKYSDIQNADKIKFYIYLSEEEGGQPLMALESYYFGGESSGTGGDDTQKYDDYGGVVIEKQDVAGNNVQGATFQFYEDKACTIPLKNEDGANVMITTNADGKGNACKMDRKSGVPVGTWYIKELSAPNALYTEDNTIYQVTVKKGTVTYVGTRVGTTSKTNIAFYNKIVDGVDPDDIKYGKISVSKTSASNGAALALAKYNVIANEDITVSGRTIYNKDEIVTTIVTNQLGEGEAQVLVGNYRVQEAAAPAGYVVASVAENTTVLAKGDVNTLNLTDDSKTSSAFTISARSVIPGGYQMTQGQFVYRLSLVTGMSEDGKAITEDLGLSVQNGVDGIGEFPEMTINGDGVISYKVNGETVTRQTPHAGTFVFAITEDAQTTAANDRYTNDATTIYVTGTVTDSGKNLSVKLNYVYGTGDLIYRMANKSTSKVSDIVASVKKTLTEEEINALHMNETLTAVTAGEKAVVSVKKNGSDWDVKAEDLTDTAGKHGESVILLRYIGEDENKETVEYTVPVMIIGTNKQSEGIFCNVFNAPLPTDAPVLTVTNSDGQSIDSTKTGTPKVKYMDSLQYDVYQSIPQQKKANYFSKFAITDTLPAGINVKAKNVKILKKAANTTEWVDDSANWTVNITHDNAPTAEEQQYTVKAARKTALLDEKTTYGAEYDLRIVASAGQETESKAAYYDHASVEIVYQDVESMYALDEDGNVRYIDGEMQYDAFNGYDNSTKNNRGTVNPISTTNVNSGSAKNFPDGTALANSQNNKFESKVTKYSNAAMYHRTTNEVKVTVNAFFADYDPYGMPTWEISKAVLNTNGQDIDLQDIKAGDVLTYKIYVRNNLEKTSGTVNVTDTLPSVVEFVDTDHEGVCTNGTITWSNVDFSAKSLVTLTTHVKVKDVTGASNIDNKATAIVTPKIDDPEPSNPKTTNTVHNYVPKIVKIVTTKNGNNANGLFINNGDELYYHVFVTNTDTAGTDPYRTGIHTYTIKETIPDNAVLIGKTDAGAKVSASPEPGDLKVTTSTAGAIKECESAEYVSWKNETLAPGEIREYVFAVKAVGDGKDIISETETTTQKKETVYSVYTEVVNGTISATARELKKGSSQTVSYSANNGFHLAAIMVDGKAVSLTDYASSYEFKDIRSDHYIKVVYAPAYDAEKTYTITTQIEGGSISDDILNIEPGSNEKVAYRANSGWSVDKVIVDGKEISDKSGIYAFNNVQADHTIRVICKSDTGSLPYNKDDATHKSNTVVNSTPLFVEKVMTLDGKDINKGFLQAGDTYYYTVSIFNNMYGNKKFTITDVLPDNITVTSIDDGILIESREGVANGEIKKVEADAVTKDTTTATKAGTHSYVDNTITWVAELGPNETKAFTFTFVPNTKQTTFKNDAHVLIDQWATDPTTGDKIKDTPNVQKEYDTNEVINWTPADPVKTVTRKTPTSDGKYEIQNMDTALVWGENADTLTYRISVANNSTEKKTFKITDVVDEDLAFVKASGNGKYDKATRTITWTVNMDPAKNDGKASEAYVTFDAKVNTGSVIASANNYATLLIDEAYPVSNETDTDIDETPTKTVTDAAGNDIDSFLVNKNDELTYTIRVKNPDELTKRFTIKDYVPETTELISVTAGEFELTEWSQGYKTTGTSTFEVSVANGSTKELSQDVIDTLTKELCLTFVSEANGTVTFTGNTENTEDMISSIYSVIGEGYLVTGTLNETSANVSAAGKDDVNYVLVNGKEAASASESHRYNVSAQYTAVVGENIPSGKYTLTSNGSAGYITICDGNSDEVANYKVGTPVMADKNKKDTAISLGSKQTISLSKGYSVSVYSTNGTVAYLTPAGTEATQAKKNSASANSDISDDAIAAENSEIVWTCDIPSGEEYAFTYTVRAMKKSSSVPSMAEVTVDKSSVSTNLVQNWIPDDPMKAVTQDGSSIKGKVFFRPDEEHFTYEITVKNPAEDKKTFTVTDVLDEALVIVKASDNAEIDGQNVTWEIPVAGGATKVVSVEVYLKSGTTRSRVYNSANVASDEFEYTTNTEVVYVTDPPVKAATNSTSTSTSTLTSSSSSFKSSAKNINNKIVMTGDSYSYTITWYNPTDSEQTYTVTDTLPDQVSFVSANNGGSESGGVVTWSNISVSAESYKTVSVVVKVKEGYEEKTIENTSYVAYSTNENLYKHSSNTVKTYVGNFQKTVTDMNGNSIYGYLVTAGEKFRYDIFVWNGTGRDQTINLTDTVPSSLTVDSASDGSKVSNNEVKWTSVTVPDGGKHFTIDVTVKDTASSTKSTSKSSSTDYLIKNTATMKTDYTSTTVTSNEARVWQFPQPTKTADKTTAKPGEDVTYTIHLVNPSKDAKVFSVVDTVNAGMTIKEAKGAKVNGQTATWSVTVPGGSEQDLKLVTTVKETAATESSAAGSTGSKTSSTAAQAIGNTVTVTADGTTITSTTASVTIDTSDSDANKNGKNNGNNGDGKNDGNGDNNSGNGNNGVTNRGTGDSSNMVLWISLAIAAAGTAAVIIYKKRRNAQ